MRGSCLALGLVLVVVFAGCSEAEKQHPAQPQLPVDLSDGAVGGTVESNAAGVMTTVTVQQGTNMAVAVNPAGDKLVISLQGVLFTLPVTGGTATAITDQLQDAREPVWSADGERIVYQSYARGNWDIRAIGSEGGTPQTLTEDEFDDREPQISAEGTRLYFSSDRGGNYDIWSKNLVDGTLIQITNSPVNESSPALSVQGSELAYAVQLSRTESELHLSSLNGDNARIITTERGTISGVSWLPGDQGLSYQLLTLDASKSPITQMKTIDLGSSETTLLSAVGSDVFPFKASWLDATTVFFAADGDILRWQAGERTNVPFSADLILHRPIYQRRQRDHDDASPRRALGLSGPAISPDGSKVAFAALGDLWLWSPDVGELVNLTDDVFAEQSPVWSPDGHRIGYISDQGGKSEFWITDLAGANHEKIPLAEGGVSFPSWSPGGESVAVFTEIPGNPLGGQLSVVELASGNVTKVNRPMPAQPVSWTIDGQHVAAAALEPYSTRYREGIYRLEIGDIDSTEIIVAAPTAHESILDAVLIPNSRSMSYVLGANLWRVELDEEFQPSAEPEKLTSELTDNPSWSAGGDYLVFMSGDRMKRLHVPSGAIDDITPTLEWTPAIAEETWVLRAGRLFDGAEDGYLENVDVTIVGNRIAAIKPAGDSPAGILIDMSDKTVIPGLFEMHAHMGGDSEAQGRTWLAYGVTSVRDPGANPYLAKARQEAWDSGRRVGPRTHVTGYLNDGNRVYYSVAEGIVSDAHLELALERADVLELDFIKTYVRLPDARQARVVEFAHGIGIPVSSHELFPAVAIGMDHVEHIGGTSRRGYQPKVSALGNSYSDVVELLSRSGMGITATAVLPGFSVVALEDDDYFNNPQFETFYGPAARDQYLAIVARFGAGAAATAKANGRLLRALADNDALLVTGTDSPFVPYGAGLHAELRLFARAGLTPFEVLRAASYKSALAAGVAADLGTLEVGKLADFVVVDGDPLADIKDADNVVMTVKGGKAYTLESLLASP